MEKGEGSHLFLRPLVSDSHLFDAGLPEEHRYAVFSGSPLPDMPYSSLLGSTVDTCHSLRVLMVQTPQNTVEVRLRMLPYSLHCLVRSGYMYCVSYGSVLTLFLRHLVSDSYLFAASPEEYTIWSFWEMTSGIFPYGALFGSTVDTCRCQGTRLS